MKPFSYFLLATVMLLSTPSIAQEKAPLIKGKVEISIKEGTFDCDLIIRDIPEIEDYLILVNAGMNIAYIRNMEDNTTFSCNKLYNSDISDECFGYFMENKKGKFLPDGLRFRYTGKFPVQNDTSKMRGGGDWKGNIAFNGTSVRTDGRQAGWYLFFMT